MANEIFDDVFDALEDDPVRRENLKLRSEIMSEINAKINEGRQTQQELAVLLRISQPRVSALRKGKVNNFRLDMLFDFSVRMGLNLSLHRVA
ncbi:MAG: transcriptional regulator [Piscirickettsiaceae bacterium]|nr:MAG: transcriptional regulator [Piscirickettsiaceae bacterium]PCI72397.1 MAG: transcriptional regulator [Piscirickettsiaceae bacterium]